MDIIPKQCPAYGTVEKLHNSGVREIQSERHQQQGYYFVQQ